VKIKACMKRAVVSIPASTTIREAGKLVVDRHIGLLPIIDDNGILIGVVSLQNLISLELPDFVKLIDDIDFIHDFGAVETNIPESQELEKKVSTLMQPAISVNEECGLLRAYALLLQHHLLDLPVVAEDGRLVGLASRVDIGVAILSRWKSPSPEQL
jgi:CBS domain-containing protein